MFFAGSELISLIFPSTLFARPPLLSRWRWRSAAAVCVRPTGPSSDGRMPAPLSDLLLSTQFVSCCRSTFALARFQRLASLLLLLREPEFGHALLHLV